MKTTKVTAATTTEKLTLTASGCWKSATACECCKCGEMVPFTAAKTHPCYRAMVAAVVEESAAVRAFVAAGGTRDDYWR